MGLCMLMQIKKIFCKHNTSTIDVNIVACFSTGFRGNCMRPHGVEKQEKCFFFCYWKSSLLHVFNETMQPQLIEVICDSAYPIM